MTNIQEAGKMSTTYKKKSHKQIVRDKSRLAKRRRVNNSNLDSSIETDRAETNQPDISKPCVNCSPPITIDEECIPIDKDIPHVLDIPNADDFTQPESCAYEDTEKTADDLTPSEFCASESIVETNIVVDNITCNGCNSCTNDTPNQDLRENALWSDQRFLNELRAAFNEAFTEKAEVVFEKLGT